jgi:hypothetical protein
MELAAINEHLRREEPGTLILQSYDVRGRELVLAFTCDGGPREDEAFVVQFHETALVHLPSVLYAPVFFRVADAEDGRRLVPPASYDADELSGGGGGFTVVVLEDGGGAPYGYYVAAESVDAAWRPRKDCLR